MNQYTINPEDCLIVRAIHQSQSLREAASLLGCDAGGLLRKVQRIAETHDLLCKLEGKWGLTSKGYALLAWTEESILSQKMALESKTVLRIASTTWFAEQALIPNLKLIKDELKNLGQLSLTVPNEEFESALKSGAADICLVCHAPYDPSVSFKKICDEEWVTIAPISYKKNLQKKGREALVSELEKLPFIYHNKLNPSSVISGVNFKQTTTFTLDNLVGVRAAVVSGLGWSVVPKISIREALQDQKVFEIKELRPEIPTQVYVWWPRDRKELKKTISVIDHVLKESLS